jgi:hypothetical protein
MKNVNNKLPVLNNLVLVETKKSVHAFMTFYDTVPLKGKLIRKVRKGRSSISTNLTFSFY